MGSETHRDRYAVDRDGGTAAPIRVNLDRRVVALVDRGLRDIGHVSSDAVAALELAAARAWPAPISERLGDWWLRSADGFTGRANSALPVGDSGLAPADALGAIVSFYRSLGRRPYIDAPMPLAHPIAEAALALGWTVVSTVLVQTIELPDLIAATPPPAGCDLLDAPSADHLASVAAPRGALPPAAIHVLTAVDRVTFAEIRDGSALIGRARGTVTDGWLGLFAIETAPAARRRGIAAAMIGSLSRWADDLGAVGAYLQVEDVNKPARALYASLGFTTHHRYTRLAAPTL
jgi:GNAT superfamily N-acetyltransferase